MTLRCLVACSSLLAAVGCGEAFSADGGGGTSTAGGAGQAGSAGSAGSAGGSGASGAAGAGGGCATDFCASFDDVSTPTSGWDVSEVVGTGAIALLPAASAPTAPNVLEARLAVAEPNTLTYHSARLSLQPSALEYESSTPRLELSFAFSATKTDAKDAWASIANFRYGADEHYLVVALERASASGHRVIAFPAPAGEPVLDLGAVELGSWQRIRMTIPKRSAQAGSPVGGGATVELDGAPKTLILPPASLTPDLRFDLGLGISNAAGGDFVVRYDDVSITYAAQ